MTANGVSSTFHLTGLSKDNYPLLWQVVPVICREVSVGIGYLPGGIGWYRKHFEITDDAPRHYIYFEGAYNRSEVYLNGHLLGKRPNGYISFMYDMTPYLKEGENVLAVRIDHSRYADSRWYTGSGIYRDVWMIAAQETHFAQWGVGWQATSISDKRASIAVDMQVEKHEDITGTLKVKATLYNKEGKQVAQKSANIKGRESRHFPTRCNPERIETQPLGLGQSVSVHLKDRTFP